MKKCDLLTNWHFPFNKTDRYGRDKSSSKLYQFNSLGFRGEEYNPDAKFRFFVFGPSSAFVTGLNIEEAFGYQFKRLLAIHKHWDIDDVNFMNFAVAATSTDYSVRNMFNQCSEVKPDLIIIDLSHKSRMEWVRANGKAVPYGMGLPRTARVYWEFYEDEFGFVNLIKNILLAQYFCSAHKIRCLFLNDVTDFDEFTNNRVIKNYMQMVVMENICHTSHLERLDHAADTTFHEHGDVKWFGHAGPETNLRNARLLLEKYLENTTFPETEIHQSES